MALLEIKNLTFSYNGSEHNVLEDINLSINQGEFVLICGESGCGKSTLLRLIKKQLRPSGNSKGQILYKDISIDDLDEKTSVCDIGYVMQNPDNQIVTDKVWHELAFALENIGEKSSVIRRKIAEVCGFFGISDWYHKKTSELSGGQKQLLSLASIMVMDPNILILDEPTAQLDPIVASEFLQSLHKINQELGITIIIVEHRLDEVFPIADKVVVMDKAKIHLCDTPRNIGTNLSLFNNLPKMYKALPTPIRVFNETNGKGVCPLTINEGKKYIIENFNKNIIELPVKEEIALEKEIALEIKNGYFRYERETPDILNNLDIEIYKDEVLCIMGANGAGKTTLLKILSGVKKLYKGKYRVWNKKIKEYKGNSLYRNNIACMPQNPQDLFIKNNVYDDLFELTKILSYKKIESEKLIEDIVTKLEIKHLLNQHPYDLSGGEQQKVALAKILLMNPKIILFDEPTKGLDAYSKSQFAEIINSLKKEGKTIVIVTHDIEFAANYADRCAMFFDGQIVSIDNSINFFSTNKYYTTQAIRMTRQHFKNAINAEMVIKLCKLNER